MTNPRPKLLDLFCGAGGAAMSYYRAGFDVVGVDIKPQPHFPFTFFQGDAIAYAGAHGREFDVIHASPPCQEYSQTRYLRNACAKAGRCTLYIRAMLIGEVRTLLERIGKLWIIENVAGAPLPSAIEICGTALGLPLLRHRWFESNILLFAPGPCHHPEGFYGVVGGKVRGYGRFASDKTYLSATGEIRKREAYPGKRFGVLAMGIDWMTVAEMSEAIPPAYTEFVGRQLIQAVAR
jgi:DNA (cytosine-5)-methyltransferase 1